MADPDLLPPDIAVVVPVYDNEDALDELHRRLTAPLEAMGHPYTVTYVDDAGRDGSWAWIQATAAADPHVRGLRLARNVGQTRAICVGFEEVADARVVATIDADLDFDPADLPLLVEPVLAGADLAAGVRVERTDRWLARLWPSVAFNLAMRAGTGYRLGDVGCGYFAMSGALTRQIPGGQHRRLAIRPLLAELAGPTVTVPVRYRSRPGAGLSSARRLDTALEVLAVHPRPRLLAGAAAALLAAAGVRRWPPLLVPAAGFGALAFSLARRHRAIRAGAQGPLGDVAERVGG